MPVIGKVFTGVSSVFSFSAEVLPVSPHKRFFVKTTAVSALFVVLTSITPGGTFISTANGYSLDYVNSYSLPGDILVSDDEGYLVKINPQTDESSRIGMTDLAVHTVESGESLSVIAEKYGISSKTIQWENNITNVNSIRAGQKLLIPPVNGVSYKVKSADTIDKIAEKYDISAESIIAQNSLSENAVAVKGQDLFLPGAEPIAPPVAVATTYISSGNTTVPVRVTDYSAIPTNTTSPTGGKIFIYPTKGGITQGYHSGHYAIDIADRSKPPIWAPASGTIVKVSTGTWGGGYGNHIIIDHGNGLRSLYAHLDSVNVSNGQWVNQGDVIGIMGNTGRVYGVTGIHLHWEVIDNGVKRNPTAYY